MVPLPRQGINSESFKEDRESFVSQQGENARRHSCATLCAMRPQYVMPLGVSNQRLYLRPDPGHSVKPILSLMESA